MYRSNFLLLIFSLFIFSCVQGNVINGAYVDNVSGFGGLRLKNVDTPTAYVEIDLAGYMKSGTTVAYQLHVRYIDIQNSYACAFYDDGKDGTIEIGIGGYTGGTLWSGKGITTSLLANDQSLDGQTLGCEVTKDNIMNLYLNRKLLVTYTLGTASQDTSIHSSGAVGFGISDDH